MIRLSGVSHAYGGDPVVDDLSLSVEPGEVLAITGVGPAERVFENPTDDRTRKLIAGELVY